MASHRGFGQIDLIIFGVIALGVLGYVLHCEHVKKDRAQFIAKLEAQAKVQEAKNKEREKADRIAKEKTDAEAKKLRADNAVLSRRLRDERARAGFVPPATAGARHPDRAAFDRAELERALQRLDDGVSAVVAEGDQARIGLDAARAWSNTALRPRPPE